MPPDGDNNIRLAAGNKTKVTNIPMGRAFFGGIGE